MGLRAFHDDPTLELKHSDVTVTIMSSISRGLFEVSPLALKAAVESNDLTVLLKQLVSTY